MELKLIGKKLRGFVGNYRYVFIVLAIGLALLLIPTAGKNEKEPVVNNPIRHTNYIDSNVLAEILQRIEGAGRVEVMLSVAAGEQTIFQTDSDTSQAADSSDKRMETVIVTDSARNESGLVQQVNPPVYLGAIIVCDGGDNIAVKLAITQAVGKLTGLGADSICVLKMK